MLRVALNLAEDIRLRGALVQDSIELGLDVRTAICHRNDVLLQNEDVTFILILCHLLADWLRRLLLFRPRSVRGA